MKPQNRLLLGVACELAGVVGVAVVIAPLPQTRLAFALTCLALFLYGSYSSQRARRERSHLIELPRPTFPPIISQLRNAFAARNENVAPRVYQVPKDHSQFFDALSRGLPYQHGCESYMPRDQYEKLQADIKSGAVFVRLTPKCVELRACATEPVFVKHGPDCETEVIEPGQPIR